jgi:hypothetical protein
VPGGELFGLPPERLEGFCRMQQVSDVMSITVEVLTPQPEAEVSGERPRAVPEASGVTRLPGVQFGVQHAD